MYPCIGMVLLIWDTTYLLIIKYPHNRCHKVLMTQDVYMSAELFSDLISTVNVPPIAIDSQMAFWGAMDN